MEIATVVKSNMINI